MFANSLLTVNDILTSLKSVQQENPTEISEDLMKRAMETLLKDQQWFPDDIRNKILEVCCDFPNLNELDLDHHVNKLVFFREHLGTQTYPILDVFSNFYFSTVCLFF